MLLHASIGGRSPACGEKGRWFYRDGANLNLVDKGNITGVHGA